MTKNPRKPPVGKSLADIFPDVAAQWHHKNNGSLTPSNFLPGSNMKVWWQCQKGHEWQAIIQSRLISQKCPYCIGRHVSPDNCLAVTHKNIASEWHPSKNNDLNSSQVTYGQNKRVWWLCNKGHEWEALIKARTSGTSCPYCANRLVGEDNNLAVLFPKLTEQWHPSKNGSLTPEKVTAKSSKKIWWLCPKGHEWQAVISVRSNGAGCPECRKQKRKKFRVPPIEKSLAVQKPELAAEWHPSRNENITPQHVTPGSSSSKFWWRCAVGHEWKTKVLSRSSGSGCPYCSGAKVSIEKSLLTLEPLLAKQWHPEKNQSFSPAEVSPGSGRKVWWVCDKGHEWDARIHKRVTGHGCPYCSGRRIGSDNNLAVLNPELAQQWHPIKNNELTANDVTPNSHWKVWWVCNRQHEWQAVVSNRNQGTGCPYCSNQTSRPEIRIYSELVGIFHDVSRRRKVHGYELDVFLEPYKTGIEYDGAYYHAQQSEHDEHKNRALMEKGIDVIRVREKPLDRISDSDIICNVGKLRKKDVDQLLRVLRDRCKEVHKKRIDDYLIKSKFQSSGVYRKVLSYLPGPPPSESLQAKYPELSRLWNTERNFPLTPDQFPPKSNKKVWCICEKGHEWNTKISQLTNGLGCPYCLGRRVGHDNNLAFLKPVLSQEWHPVKNGSKSPSNFTVGSQQSIWWQCDKGHEWRAAIVSRTSGQGCPFCAGRLASEENNLALLNPELSAQWHKSKNDKLTPREVTQFSQKKVWWRCDSGHEWKVSVASRSGGTGCPYCSGNRVSDENNLAVVNPKLAKQWNHDRNGDFSPSNVTPGSTKKAWWRCGKGHEWKATIYDRHYGAGCPYCSGNRAGADNNFAVKNPRLAEEWHPTKNIPFKPTQFTSGSGKKVWWLCSKGHEWQAGIGGRVRGRGCPFCSGSRVTKESSFASVCPHLVSQWHPTKNNELSPDQVAKFSHKIVWWICERGHEWKAAIGSRTNGNGCPSCWKLRQKHNAG